MLELASGHHFLPWASSYNSRLRMKKFLLAIILLAFAAHAEDLQGVRANIELVTGAKQTAQFLGIQQDTVSLGGMIKGNFTVIKIAKNRFKSIVDENGKDLLNEVKASTDSTVAAVDSAATDSSAIDSAAVETAAESSAAVSPAETFLNTVDGKHVIVALERRSIDSVLASQLNVLIARMLQESGIPVVSANRTDFGFCRESACIKDSLVHYGAASVYMGSIIAAKSTDSVTIQMVHHNLADSSQKDVKTVQMNLSTMTALSDAMSNDKLKNFTLQLQGKELPKPKQNRSYIHVETDPEGVTLATATQGEICRSPCTFATQDSGKVALYAYWNVDKQLWGARQVIVPIPFDTTKISLKLKQTRPELRIMTTPSKAEIYAGSDSISVKSKAIGKTPNKFPIYEPGTITVKLRKEGYRDTTITTFVPPTDLTDINVELQPITDIEELRAQEAWTKKNKVRKIGLTLLGSSLAPIIVGGLFTYLASENYDKADKLKQELSRPATAGGEHYLQKIQENHDLVNKGKRQMAIGGSLLGAGLVILGVGITLTF